MALISGTTGSDNLLGTAQGDTINGIGGNDYLEGGLGGDTLNGGAGSDMLFSSENLVIYRDPEEGPLTYLWDADAVADTLDGGADDDALFAGINDTVRGGEGEDLVWLDFEAATSGVVADLTAAFAGGTSTVGRATISGIEAYVTIIGSAHGDVITLTGSERSFIFEDVRYWQEGVFAGDGDDRVTGGFGRDLIYGGAGADRLIGESGDDFLASGSDPAVFFDIFADFLLQFPAWDAGTEIDLLEGGVGDDRAFIGLGDSYKGGGEDPSIYWGSDEISIWLGAATSGVTVDLRAAFAGGESRVAGGVISGVANFEAIHGSDHADVIDVNGGAFVKSGDVMAGLFGKDGADRIAGSGDGDIVFGGNGADTLIGRAGDDWLYAGAPDEFYSDSLGGENPYGTYYVLDDKLDSDVDALFGGAGDDVLSAGAGDSVDGGSGEDTIILNLSSVTGPVKMDLTAAFAGGSANIDGAVWRGLERYGQIAGSEFADTIILGDARIAETAYGGSIIALGGGDDALSAGRDADTVYGGDGDDRISGRGGDDALYGSSGADTLNGGDGYDTLDGGDGDDVLSGGAGDDLLVGGEGNDSLLGGKGADWVDYSRHFAVQVDLAITGRQDTGGAGLDRLNDIENVIGSTRDDRLRGDDRANALDGSEGRDSINGRGGDDVLTGGAGRDALTGGTGRDTFVFMQPERSSSLRDRITDFESGTDHLALDREAFSAFEGASAGGIAANAFVLGREAATTQQSLIYDRTAGLLYYDADGSGAGAQVLIAELGAGTVLAAQDILLV